MQKRGKRGTTGADIVVSIVLVAAIGVAGFSSWKLIEAKQEYDQAENVYKDLSPVSVSLHGQAEGENGAESEEWVLDWDSLRAINKDVVGWISLNDTVINYPIVQGEDNDWYLEHLFDGTYNKSGCIFVNSSNSGIFTDTNTAMYGHNMRNGTMFAPLEKYRDQQFADTHKSIFIYTPDGDYVVEPFAGVVYSEDEHLIRFGYGDESSFMDYVNDLRARSVFSSDTVVDSTDQIATFSTCDYSNGDFSLRFAIFGVVRKL